MELDLVNTLLVIWFLVTFFYLCSWIIGNFYRDKKNVFNNGKMAKFFINISIGYLIFVLLAILFLYFIGQIDLKFIIEALIAMIAIFISLGLFYLSLDPNKRFQRED